MIIEKGRRKTEKSSNLKKMIQELVTVCMVSYDFWKYPVNNANHTFNFREKNVHYTQVNRVETIFGKKYSTTFIMDAI